MDKANEAPIKEYREFTITNNFRKMAEEIIGPFVKMENVYKNRLEVKLSGVLEQNEEVKKKVTAMEEKLGKSKTFEREISEMKKIVEELRIENFDYKKKMESKLSNIDGEYCQNNLEVHSLKQKLQNYEESLKRIEEKNVKINEMYSSISTNNNKIMSEVQEKYVNFTKGIIDTSSKLDEEHKSILNLMEKVNREFKLEKENKDEQFKHLQLYLAERNTISEEISQLKTNVRNCVSYFDFEGYCKSQKVIVDNFVVKIENYIEEIFPKSLRSFFPTIEQKLEEVGKIAELEKNSFDTLKNFESITSKITETKNTVSERFQSLNNQIREENKAVEDQIHQKLKQMENKQVTLVDVFDLKMREVKVEVKNEVSEILESEFGRIRETLESDLADNDKIYSKGKSQTSQEEIFKNAESVKKIEEKMSEKFIKIEELGQTIDFRIENYSSRITKIKSDFELFSENMKKEMKGVSKFKATFEEKLKGLGNLMSNFVEIMMINTSINIQKEQEEFIETVQYENKEQVVFVTENDGIIYEWKPENPKGMITYRRKQMDMRQLLLSTMFSLITLVDEKLKDQELLNWEENRPSTFFSDHVFTNYKISENRTPDYRDEIIKNFNRSQTFRSNNLKPNHSYKVPLENEHMNQSSEFSVKQFSKTIDTSAKVSRPIEEGNYLSSASDTRRQYSLKRQNLSSGNPKSKIVKDKEGTQRYIDPFFTTRSACRSRISQIV